MKVVIPIAGYGKRFEPFTQNNQKCLIPIFGTPMLKYNIDFLINEGFNDISFILGHCSDNVIEFLNENFSDVKFSFYYQKEILGLGHAIYNALNKNQDNPVLIILGDLLLKKHLNMK